MTGRISFLILFSLLLLQACHRQSPQELTDLGALEVQRNNPKGAAVYFLNALKQDPEFIDARQRLGFTYLSLRKFQQAEVELQRVLKTRKTERTVILALAEIYNYKGRGDETISLVSTLPALAKEDPLVYQVMGNAYRVKGLYQKACDVFREGLALSAEDPDLSLGLAAALIDNAEPAVALELLKQVVSKNRRFKEAYRLLAGLQIRSGDRDAALQTLHSLAELTTEDPDVLFMIGLLHFDQRNIKKGGEIGKDLLTEFPLRAQGRQLLGIAAYLQEDFAKAIVDLQLAKQINSSLIGSYFLGLAHYRIGQFEQALNAFQKALDHKPDHLQSRLLVAQTLLKQRRIDAAIPEIAKVLQKDARNGFAYDLLGSAYMAKGDYDRAGKYLDLAIAYQPDLVDARVKKGLFNFARGEVKLAESTLMDAINTAPEILNSRLLLATHYLRTKKIDDALNLLQKGLAGTPDDAVIYNYMAVAYFANSEEGKAVAALGQAKKAKNDYLSPYRNLANYYAARGDISAALDEYSQALLIVPGNLRLLLGAAALEEYRGDKTAALAYYQQAANSADFGGLLALADYQRRTKKYSAAIVSLAKAEQAQPHNPRLLERKGLLLKEMGRFSDMVQTLLKLEKLATGRGLPHLVNFYLSQGNADLALDAARKARTNRPGLAYGYALLASVEQRLGRLDDAEKTLVKGMGEVRNSLSLQISLGEVYVARNELPRAVSHFESLRQKSPHNPQVLFVLGNLRQQQRDYQAAGALYEEVLSLNPNYTSAQNNLAYVYAVHFGRNADALRLATRAYRAAPGNPAILDTFGLILVRTGQIAGGLKLLEKAALQLPEDPSVRLHLAQALLANGRNDEARVQLERLRKSEDHEIVAQATKELARVASPLAKKR